MKTFEQLQLEYSRLLARMVITRFDEVHATAVRLLKTRYHFDPVAAKTGVPAVWGMASFEREASSNFRLSPAQGDPWDRRSTHVPRGRGPFKNWEEACIDAYKLDGLDKVDRAKWTWERACYEGELFNGFGYRNRGVNSPYLWAGSNNYRAGKYIADGVWSSTAVDQQLGIVPMMVAMVSIDPTLALTNAMPTALPPLPQPPPSEFGNAEELQIALNKLGADPPLLVDGNIGRHTRSVVRVFQMKHGLEADGIAGPLTWKVIREELKKVPA